MEGKQKARKRHKVSERKQKMAKTEEEWNMKNTYKEVEQEIDRIEEECVRLQEKREKRWKRTGILCGVFLILGVAISVGAGIYFQSKTRGIEKGLEQEYNAKREVILEQLGEK